MMKPSLRSTLSGVCFTLGAVWGLAAALKLTFGTAISFPLLPPFDLAHINVAKSVIVALSLFAVGAVLGRRRRTESDQSTNTAERAV